VSFQLVVGDKRLKRGYKLQFSLFIFDLFYVLLYKAKTDMINNFLFNYMYILYGFKL